MVDLMPQSLQPYRGSVNFIWAQLYVGVHIDLRAWGKNQPPDKESRWQEGAGSLLLLAAAQETGLLSALEEALPTGGQVPLRLTHATTKTRRQGLLTLLFLPAVGLQLTWDLRVYSGDALGLL